MRIALLLLLLSSFTPVKGATYYITQNATGADDGSSCANGKSRDWASVSAANGDTLRLCGTITNTLVVPNDNITVIFEAGAKISAASNLAGIYLQSRYNCTIDGGVDGIIEQTASGHGRAFTNEAYGVLAATCPGLTVKNLRIRGIFYRTDLASTNGGGIGIQNTCAFSPFYIRDFIVTNCFISDCTIGISSDYGAPQGGISCSNYWFAGNTLSNVNWGGNCSDRDASSVHYALLVENNKILSFTNWNDTVGNAYHHNGFYGWAESGGKLLNPVFRGNTVGPGLGGPYQTSGVFFSGRVSNVWIYNNVFITSTAPNDYAANGMITASRHNTGWGGTAYRVYNNTFSMKGVGAAISGGVGDGTHYVNNNVGTNCTLILWNYATDSQLICDYNIGWNLISGQEYSFSTTGSSSFKTLNQWQALGYDTHGTNLNPLLTSAYRLSAGSPAIDYGTNLNAFFTTDASNISRGVAWDVGAFEFMESVTGTTRITASGTARVGRMMVP